MEDTFGNSQSIGVVGGGLVGCLSALAFAAKGYSVSLFERRPNPSKETTVKDLVSINLAVSERGLEALRYVNHGLAQRVLDNSIPMKGRMIHDKTGKKQESIIYGLFGECIRSIDRSLLNNLLLEELENWEIKVYFDHKFIELDRYEPDSISHRIKFVDLSLNETNKTRSYEFDFVIGADGAHSQFRYQMQKQMRMDYSQKYIDMQYLELHIDSAPKKEENRFRLDPNHLHIWPRKSYMLIALPNVDGSFMCTYFSPWSQMESFKNADEFANFFKNAFPDAYDLMGKDHVESAFANHKRGYLMQNSSYPYHHPLGRALIIGDAAHLMVPFYGQGLNCGFEDVHFLMKLIDKNPGNIIHSFSLYSEQRKSDLDTICHLAMQNYFEMALKVTQASYLFRKKLDYFLGKYVSGRFIKWIPMYTMISFRADIPYSRALAIEKRQSKILYVLEKGTIISIVALGVIKFSGIWKNWSRSL